MSIRSKLLAAATTLTLAGSLAAAGTLAAGPAGAATRSCGPRCIDIFSRASGTHARPNVVLSVLGRGARAGQPIVGSPASRLDPGEDFTVSFQGRVSAFYSAGLVTTWLALRYGGLGCLVHRPASSRCLRFYPDDYAYEIEYAPLGVDSGLCVGTSAAAGRGTPVSLQPCGVSARTVWVTGAPSCSCRGLFHQYLPLISGSQAGSRSPYVLTYRRARQLTTEPLRSTRHGAVISAQRWGANLGMVR
jgi:hypothetical protein